MTDRSLQPHKAPRGTPCIGICSTTYGDLVCRGCKRYSHEIVQWNGFTEAQRERVHGRLEQLQAQAVGVHAYISDSTRLALFSRQLGIESNASSNLLSCAYRLLRAIHTARGRSVNPSNQIDINPVSPELSEIGLMSRASSQSLSDLFRAIEHEFYQRSLAHYEHSFRTPIES